MIKLNDRKQRKQIEMIINLLSSANVSVTVHDFDGAFIYANQATFDLHGYSRDEFMSLNLHELDDPESAKLIAPRIQQLMETGETSFEVSHYRKDRSTFPLLVNACITEWEGQKAILSITSDVTEHKMTEEALWDSEKKYRIVVDKVNDGIVIIQNDIVRFANPKISTILGYESGEIEGLEFTSFIAPENLGLALERYHKRMAGEKLPEIYEIALLHKNGSKISVETSGSVIQYEGRLADLAIIRDVSERKNTEKILRDREKKYSTLVESIPDMIVRFDADLRYIFCNVAVERQFGVSADMFMGKTPLELSSLFFEKGDEQTQFVSETLKGALETGEGCQVEQSFPFPSGTRIFQTRIIPENDEYGKIVSLLAISSDITDSRNLEMERSKLVKLESIGSLAGGIAHDFNNILTAVIGNISLAKMDVESNNKKEAMISIDMVEKASLKAKGLTQQLLTFSKGGSPVRRVASLSKIIKDSVDFIMSGSNIKSNFSIPSDLWNANIDEGQIGQVMHNLIINAQQAMSKGGKIEIVAENVIIDKKSKSSSSSFLHCSNFKNDNYVRISVTDQGEGISQDIMDKIFDPFFTTKTKGSGLGLATSYSIVHKHGGYLRVESEKGKGATFFLYLPAVLEPEIAVVTTFVESSNLDARILIMDDNEDLRESLRRVLRQIGYSNMEFTENGSEAVSSYKKSFKTNKKFDVVILDLTVPGGMGGEETIKKLRKFDPNVSAIVSSGYVDKEIMSDHCKYGFKAALPKPYTIDDIRECMEKAMKMK